MNRTLPRLDKNMFMYAMLVSETESEEQSRTSLNLQDETRNSRSLSEEWNTA